MILNNVQYSIDSHKLTKLKKIKNAVAFFLQQCQHIKKVFRLTKARKLKMCTVKYKIFHETRNRNNEIKMTTHDIILEVLIW